MAVWRQAAGAATRTMTIKTIRLIPRSRLNHTRGASSPHGCGSGRHVLDLEAGRRARLQIHGTQVHLPRHAQVALGQCLQDHGDEHELRCPSPRPGFSPAENIPMGVTLIHHCDRNSACAPDQGPSQDAEEVEEYAEAFTHRGGGGGGGERSEGAEESREATVVSFKRSGSCRGAYRLPFSLMPYLLYTAQ